eukprot:CAMPEP_0194224582 /NCGR_PEP_ID=MMETSP0156-20130528/37827_1 /TAXON_ID=33649 /ORGANISM="Thalassionema nitzschioides, Strain L26-B" /LENGTH=575 /DNA_ID=CAMNT_0038956223 /DNA_START=252 /DNA_END=1979 /DNA_ORIENTATION=-
MKKKLNRQTRSYIFFEYSHDDLFKSILKTISRKKQNLRQSKDDRKREIVVAISNTRDQWKIQRRKIVSKVKQKKLKYVHNHLKAFNRMLRTKANEAKHRSKARWDLFWNKSRTMKQRLIDRYSKAYSDPELAFTPYVVKMDEPFKTQWFSQPGGYPLTAKDPRTGRFCNPWNSISTNGFKRLEDIWRWKKTRFTGSFLEKPKELEWNTTEARREELKAKAFIPTPGEIQLTWIGHATNLIHFSDKFKVLTDPVFSHKASPLQVFENYELFGVPRLVPPSLSIDDLSSMGGVDVCVISHDHYDHLDFSSVQELSTRRIVKFWAVPMGMKDWLLTNIDDIDEDSIIEMEWWQSITLIKEQQGKDELLSRHEELSNVLDMQFNDGGSESTTFSGAGRSELTVTCAPAQHWCSRTPFDRNTRLWCSWAIHSKVATKNRDEMAGLNEEGDTSKRLSFYFAGDTAYPKTFPLHRQIGDMLGPFDVACIPIGAYKPRFFMQDSHCDPHEAAKIHEDIQAKRSIAIHWGTFPLANEPFEEPPALLHQAAGQKNIDFVVIPHGESVQSETVSSSLSADFIINQT